MESTLVQPHPIQPVKDTLILPYLAAVLIVSSSEIGPICGSRVIIDQNTVLTVAHVVYDRRREV